MLKLKTKTEFQVPHERGMKSVIVRMIISHFSMIDINNIKLEGYYYFLDEEGNIVKLINSDFGQNAMKQWSDIEVLENADIVPVFESNKNLKSNLLQRLKELTMLQLQQEAGENYGTIASDWEEDTE